MHRFLTLLFIAMTVSAAWAGPPALPKGVETVTTGSGLQYAIIGVGDGEAVRSGQTAIVHYTGWLKTDGTKFDSSVDRGQPFPCPVGQAKVIKGWDEGLVGMKPGEKRRLFIPSKLGYGTRGAGGAIPPNADLVFDVELIEVVK